MANGPSLQPQPLLRSKAQPGDEGSKIRRRGLTPRQQELNRRWSWYCGENYNSYKADWEGREEPDPVAKDQIASSAQLPPGYIDARGLPLSYRKPSAPYRLPRVITNRFTGLLFSERHHPTVHVQGDQDTEDFINQLAKDSRLWQRMLGARSMGGGQGTVVLGFAFIDGKPRIDVHDARWCTPTWKDRQSFTLESLEKRYMFSEAEIDPETGNWKDVDYWFRQVIDEQSDTLWEKVPVGDGEEPDWDRAEPRVIDHKLGFCPCVWVQNLPVEDDIDGESDCHGVYEMVQKIDQINSQVGKGILDNLDPTLVIVSSARLAEIKKGSDNAIKLPSTATTKNGDSLGPSEAHYLEITGAGIKEGRDTVREWRGYVLEVAQCVLSDEQEKSVETAFEVDRRYSAMIEKADMLREQYGECGVLRLLDMIVRAVRKLGMAQAEDGAVARRAIILSPKVVTDPDGTMRSVPHKLGKDGAKLELEWPPYFYPTPTDILNAITAAAKALMAGLVDLETAARSVAKYFQVKNVAAMIEKAKKEIKQRMQEMMTPGGGGGEGGGSRGGGF